MKLSSQDFNLRGPQRAFEVVKCSPDEKPIECMLTNDGEVLVVDGHHTLGFALGNSYDCNDTNYTPKYGIKQVFSQ